MRRAAAVLFLAGLWLDCAAAPAGEAKPEWVTNPYSAYPESLYLSAVGGGRERDAAEQSATAALAASFRKSLSDQVVIVESERQVDGKPAGFVSTASHSIQAATVFDDLMGVEIKAAWQDEKAGVWWAAAVMEKARCRELYAARLDKALRDIARLSDVSGGAALESWGRCREAEALLPRAETFALALHALDGPNRLPELTRLGAAVAASLEAVQALPVEVRVSGDVDSRIRAAFARAFTDLGFSTGGSGSRYVLRAKFSREAAPPGDFYNARYAVEASLFNTQTGAELLSWNVANRTAHPKSQREADNRALIEAVRDISGDFSQALRRFLEREAAP